MTDDKKKPFAAYLGTRQLNAHQQISSFHMKYSLLEWEGTILQDLN